MQSLGFSRAFFHGDFPHKIGTPPSVGGRGKLGGKSPNYGVSTATGGDTGFGGNQTGAKINITNA